MRQLRFGYDGDDGLGDRLVELVLAGVKTATSGLAVETTRVRIIPLDLVDDDVARDEGEGFADAAAWRAAHVRFWAAVAHLVREESGDPDWTLRPSEPVVVEWFRLVE